MPAQPPPGYAATCVPSGLRHGPLVDPRLRRVGGVPRSCLPGDDRPEHLRPVQEPLRSVRKQVLELFEGPLSVLRELPGVQQGAVLLALDGEAGHFRAGCPDFPARGSIVQRPWLRRVLSGELVEAVDELVREASELFSCLRRLRAAVGAAWSSRFGEASCACNAP